MFAVETLAGGLLGLIAALGIGAGFTRMLGHIPRRWRLAASLVSGVAIIDWAVMLVLFLGGSVTAVKIVGVGAAVLGSILLVVSWNHLSFVPALKILRNSDRWFVAIVVAACTINLFIALAPSTKIDELHYHMLIPKRVMEDDGLYLYRLPYEAAIFPQTAYQLGLTAEHAAGFPEAGNVVSWGLGVALILLVAGVATDLTGSATAGWMTGAISAVGLYPAVWWVTSGPHALGDLSTVTACLLALLPDSQTAGLKSKARLILICLAAYAAVSTKISNLPVAATITLIGVFRGAAELGMRKAAGIALAVWIAFYSPIILWTTLQCGSPLGLATATLFHSHYFGAGRNCQDKCRKGFGPEGLDADPSLACPISFCGSGRRFWDRCLCGFQARTDVDGGQRTRLRAGSSDCMVVAPAVQIPERTSICCSDSWGMGLLAVTVGNAAHGPVVVSFAGTVPSLAGRAGLLLRAVHEGGPGFRQPQRLPGQVCCL